MIECVLIVVDLCVCWLEMICVVVEEVLFDDDFECYCVVFDVFLDEFDVVEVVFVVIWFVYEVVVGGEIDEEEILDVVLWLECGCLCECVVCMFIGVGCSYKMCFVDFVGVIIGEMWFKGCEIGVIEIFDCFLFVEVLELVIDEVIIVLCCGMIKGKKFMIWCDKVGKC